MNQSYGYLIYNGTNSQFINQALVTGLNDDGTTAYSYSNVYFNEKEGDFEAFLQGTNYGGLILPRDGMYELTSFFCAGDDYGTIGIYSKNKYEQKGRIIAGYRIEQPPRKTIFRGKKGDQLSIVDIDLQLPMSMVPNITTSTTPAIRAYMIIKPFDGFYGYVSYNGNVDQVVTPPTITGAIDGITTYRFNNVYFNNIEGRFETFLQGSNYGGLVLPEDGTYELFYYFCGNDPHDIGIYKNDRHVGKVIRSYLGDAYPVKTIFEGKKGEQISLVCTDLQNSNSMVDNYTQATSTIIRAYIIIKLII